MFSQSSEGGLETPPQCEISIDLWGGFYRHEGRELYIRNIDFQATEKDLLDLFKEYGQVEKIRIPPGPRKGTHKGFGFIAFATKVRRLCAY